MKTSLADAVDHTRVDTDGSMANLPEPHRVVTDRDATDRDVPEWLVDEARRQAEQLAREGCDGTPNLLRALADALTASRARSQPDGIEGELLKAAAALPKGEWYMDNNHPWRIMIEREGPRWHNAVCEDDGDGGLVACATTGIVGDGERTDMRAIVNVLNAVRTLLASGTKAGEPAGWRSDMENAPGEDVLIAGRDPNGSWYVEEGYRTSLGHWGGRKLHPPSHWQPLPAPPPETRP